MNSYQRILAVVDLSQDSRQVAARAAALAAATAGASFTLLHVVEYMPVEPLGDSLLPSAQIEAELLQHAHTQMARFVEGFDPVPQWEVMTGHIKTAIVRAARAGSYDLIVIGSHERHGPSILVNLTEDTVLHAAPCDVLAVRLATAERSL
ncbi:MAG: universal stress protein [Steroidobacteraceae bacterium]